MARSTWHYRQCPRSPVVSPTPHTARRSAVWLSPDEEAVILDWLGTDQYATRSIDAVFTVALDAKVYVAARRTWHRVAQRHQRRRSRRRAQHPPRTIPHLVARQPNAVWSWDITHLPGPFRGHTYACYVAIDLFSRAIVAYRIEDRESDVLATEMFTAAVTRLGVTPWVIHADGGPAMTSGAVHDLFRRLHITASHNRPRVANDNPYSEAWFKTAKYHPIYPREFASLTAARAWADAFVAWYNQDHHHSGIAWHTPVSVYDGSYRAITDQRQAMLTQHYQAQPQRYTSPPIAPILPIEAWINAPP